MKRYQKKNYYDYEWKKDPNAVYIGRPSKWGNPFKVSEYEPEVALTMYEDYIKGKLLQDPNWLEPLREKNLVCYCPLNQRCHGDIIIEFLEGKKNRVSEQSKGQKAMP